MEKIIKVTNAKKQTLEDRKFWQAQTPEYRLNMLEVLRLEAGKFLYEYPARFQRVIRVTRKSDQKNKLDKIISKADVEELL